MFLHFKVFDEDNESRILACAPSNSAADLILERVSRSSVIPKKKIVRLNAYGRLVSAVHNKDLLVCRRHQLY